MKFYRLRVFRRMILSILLVALSFYAIGLLSNAYSRRTLSREVIRSLEARSRFFADQLERQVQSLAAAQIEMGNDSQVLNLYVMSGLLSPYQKTRAIRDVSEKLNSIKRLHEIAQNLLVYFPTLEKAVSATAPIYLDAGAFHVPGVGESLVSHSGPGGSIYLTTQYPYTNWERAYTPAFYVQSEITPALLSGQLLDMLGEEEGQLLLVSPEGALVAATAEDAAVPEALGKALGEAPAAPALTSREGGFTAYNRIETLGLGLAYCLPAAAVDVPLSPYVYLNGGLTVLMVLLLVVYGGYMRRAFMQPIARLLSRMENSPGLGERIESIPKDEFSVIYLRYDDMIRRMDRLIHENYQARYRTRMAELRQLQYQIRPHFLYNSIFLLYRMAQSIHAEEIAEYASHLGSYYQYITRFADHEVPLEQEIGHIRHYVDIQQARFGGRIEVAIAPLPPEARGMRLSALVLQPLVENAYEHGLRHTVAGGRLSIDMAFEEGHLRFSVEDNGPGMTPEALAQLMEEMDRAEILEDARGLANTNLRLVLRYGSGSRLRVENLPVGGLRVSVRIPGEGGGHVQSIDRG